MSYQTSLVIRLSAMGDVALSLPVVREAAKHVRLVVITKPLFAAFFENIEGVEVYTVDTNSRYRGLRGIYSLYKDLRSKYSIDKVIDLHNVIRSRILSILFRFSGTTVVRLKKGRKDKRRFIRTGKPAGLIHTVDRYKMTFIRAGINIKGIVLPALSFTTNEISDAESFIADLKLFDETRKVAIAPFAKHLTKQWAIEELTELINQLDRDYNVSFFLFGGKDEFKKLQSIAGLRKNVIILAGMFPLRKELAVLSLMDMMVCMDSSNMHMASLTGVKTVSIWGGTHPETGFSPLGNQPRLIIDIPLEDLDCRPCTIYGRGKCKRKKEKYKCLVDIKAEKVSERIDRTGWL